jgi:hypothetical protein
MAELMMGVVAPEPDADVTLMEEAGVEWIRLGCPVPFVDRVRGEVAERYARAREGYGRWADAGIKIMAVTPNPGVKRWEPGPAGKLELTWHRHLPEWFGELGSEQCLNTYEETCAWLADDLRGLVQAWQIGVRPVPRHRPQPDRRAEVLLLLRPPLRRRLDGLLRHRPLLRLLAGRRAGGLE